jgi:hypothetical protein
MEQRFTEIPGWSFDVDEVSANVYKVTAVDGAGRTFEKTGIDPDAVLEEAKQYAGTVVAALRARRV